MPVSAYVIRCSPDDQAAVQAQLRTLPGVEIGEPTETGLPVATDAPTTHAAAELGEQLQQIPGVKSAVLVYHNFEDVAEDVSPLHSSQSRLMSAATSEGVPRPKPVTDRRSD